MVQGCRTRATTLLFGCLLVLSALTGCIGYDGGAGPTSDEPSGALAPADVGSNTSTQRETKVDEVLVPGGARVGSTQAVTSSVRVLSHQPANFTGAIVEVTWKLGPSAPGLNNWTVVAGGDGEQYGSAARSEQPVRLLLNSSEYDVGALWVSVFPGGDGPVGVGATDGITIHTTVFTHGPPDWSFSAVET